MFKIPMKNICNLKGRGENTMNGVTLIVNEWHMVLTDGTEISFYTTSEDITTNPLELEEDFDAIEWWSIDACGNEELEARFDVDPVDNSFVLIPKELVERVYFTKSSTTYHDSKYNS